MHDGFPHEPELANKGHPYDCLAQAITFPSRENFVN